MNSSVSAQLDKALESLISMRPQEIVAAEEWLAALRHAPEALFSQTEIAKMVQLRNAALQSVELWQLYSGGEAGEGYTNDGLSTTTVLSLSGLSIRG